MSYFITRVPKKIKVKFSGWAQNYLDTMLNGLTGNLHELFYPFNTDCWQKQSFQDGGLEGWWPYEQAAYWLDGYLKCAYFANNELHFEKAKTMIDKALSVVDEQGFIGAKELKVQGQGNQWVHAVMLRAVLFLYSITDDNKYLDLVKNHYLSGTNDYSKWRESVNIENIVLCFMECGDKRLKDLAVKAYEAHCKDESNIETKLSDFVKDAPINLHAVTYDEMVKIPALLYCITGNKDYLNASLKGLERIRKYHMLPIGIHSGSEAFGGTGALSCVETCDITDYCWTLGYIAQITGETRFLDEIERIMYNVAPSVMDKEFKSLQYFSSMNQVVSTFNSNHSLSFTQTPRMAYQPNHYPECCTGNANRSMPNFLLRALMETDSGYRFNFYVPGEYTVNNKKFIIETNYPYEENVKIIYSGKPERMELQFRIPEWCKDFKFNCNRKAVVKDNLLIINDTFMIGDTVELSLKSRLETVAVNEGFIIQKQPIVYTLKIGARTEKDKSESRQTALFPAYNIYPVTEWQIALDNDEFISVAEIKGSVFNNLLENDIRIDSKGYLMKDVGLKYIHSSEVPISDYDRQEIIKLRNMGQVIYDGEMVFTPDIKDIKRTQVKSTDISLVPYSTATLRWTVFPNVNKIKK